MSGTAVPDRLSPTSRNGDHSTVVHDEIDDDRVVGVGCGGAFELRWQPLGKGLHDARRDLEAALGPLP